MFTLDQFRNVETVTLGDWGVSYTTGSHIQGCILNVYKRSGLETCPDCDAKSFPTRELAAYHAFMHGHLRPWWSKVNMDSWRVHNISSNVARLKDAK